MHDNTRSSGWSGDEPATWASERAIQVALQSPVPAMTVLAQRATITLINYVANYVTTETLSALVRATAGVVDLTDTLVIGDGHPCGRHAGHRGRPSRLGLVRPGVASASGSRRHG